MKPKTTFSYQKVGKKIPPKIRSLRFFQEVSETNYLLVAVVQLARLDDHQAIFPNENRRICILVQTRLLLCLDCKTQDQYPPDPLPDPPLDPLLLMVAVEEDEVEEEAPTGVVVVPTEVDNTCAVVPATVARLFTIDAAI